MNRKRLYMIVAALIGVVNFHFSIFNVQFGTARAQITTLDWDELRIDSVLPVYTEVVPLETDYRLYDYHVSIEYPEWESLRSSEIRQLVQIGKTLGPNLEPQWRVGVSRKHGMLDISFVPIVKREGKYLKLLSAQISITAIPKDKHRQAIVQTGASSPSLIGRKGLPADANRYTRKSVLSEGRWMKLSITEDGIYRLTRSALQKMGFKNPDNVRLYGYGGHRLSEVSNPEAEYDDLQEVPLYKFGNDTWLFWGNGLVYWEGNERIFNPYSTKAYYFLTEGDSPSEIKTVTCEEEPQNVYTTFVDHVLYEKDEYAWFHGGRNLYDGTNYANSNSHTYKLNTISSQGGEQLTIVFTAAASKSTEMTPVVNGTALEKMTMSKLGNYVYATEASKTTDVSKYANGSEWTIKLTSTAGNDARLDYMALHYDRLITPYQGYVAFSVADSNPAQFNITGSGLQVMRIGSPEAPACLMTGKQKDDVLQVVVDNASYRYVAFDPNYAFPQPTMVGSVENQNLHELDSLDMVIIVPTSNKLTAQAERLAEAHRQYDGLRVAVIRADQIYNEFSSGTPDATAYRRLMKMLYDRAEDEDQMPRYLLLFGDAAWDNRMISTGWRNYNPDNYLLSFVSENSYSDTQSYVMEDYFGLLDDGEGDDLPNAKTDIGVGRFPVTTASEAKIMVDKTIDFMTNANAGHWKNIICVMGDDGDNNQHLEMADDLAERIGKDNPEMEVRKVMWDAYTRVSTLTNNTYPEVKRIIGNQMKEGALVMNYTGHASTYTMSHEFVLKLEDFQAFSGQHLPLWVTAACDVMPFDGLLDNIGEAAVLNEKGAAVSFFGTTRTVYATYNKYMNRWFMHYLLTTDEQGRRYRVGDAIRLAKCYLINERLDSGYETNKLHYALLGDPALVFGAPSNRVVLDSINGELVEDGSTLQLKAGEHVRMSGHLENAQGQALTGFHGVLTGRVFDHLETIVCKNNADAAKGPFSFTSCEKVLFSGQDSVVAGRFTLNYMMPVDISFSNEGGRAVFYAISNERDVEANGYCENFIVGGISTSTESDNEGPKIYAYLNTEDFENGDRVNSTPYFVAQLEDASGINYGGNGLGHDLLLTIDNDASQTYVVNDYYTSEFGDFTKGSVAYSIPELTEGKHSLTFRAWDLLNNTNSIDLDFVVDHSLKPVMLNLTASQNPALVSTNFLISYNFPGSDCEFLVEVFDFGGRRMWSHSFTASSDSGVYSLPWNLTMSGGGRLGAGIYLYRATMRCGNSKKVSKTQKIIIHGNN